MALMRVLADIRNVLPNFVGGGEMKASGGKGFADESRPLKPVRLSPGRTRCQINLIGGKKGGLKVK